MFRRSFIGCLGSLLVWCAAPSLAQGIAPEELILKMSNEVIDSVKADKAIQAGDIARINALVDTQVMPNVDFEAMTISTVGRHWRDATAEQKKRLQQEFKTLLVRSYSGALAQVKNQTVELKPPTRRLSDTEVEVRTLVVGGSEPLRLDYRLEKASDGWKIVNVNVLGVWLVEQYRSSFNQMINAGGIDGLIDKLAARNNAGAKS